MMRAFEELDKATDEMAVALSDYLMEYYGCCPDYEPECDGCKRWAAYNVIFPDFAVDLKSKNRVQRIPELTKETVDRARLAFESGRIPFVRQDVD